jgi:hypothetical protein
VARGAHGTAALKNIWGTNMKMISMVISAAPFIPSWCRGSRVNLPNFLSNHVDHWSSCNAQRERHGVGQGEGSAARMRRRPRGAPGRTQRLRPLNPVGCWTTSALAAHQLAVLGCPASRGAGCTTAGPPALPPEGRRAAPAPAPAAERRCPAVGSGTGPCAGPPSVAMRRKAAALVRSPEARVS